MRKKVTGVLYLEKRLEREEKKDDRGPIAFSN